MQQDINTSPPLIEGYRERLRKLDALTEQAFVTTDAKQIEERIERMRDYCFMCKMDEKEEFIFSVHKAEEKGFLCMTCMRENGERQGWKWDRKPVYYEPRSSVPPRRFSCI